VPGTPATVDVTELVVVVGVPTEVVVLGAVPVVVVELLPDVPFAVDAVPGTGADVATEPAGLPGFARHELVVVPVLVHAVVAPGAPVSLTTVVVGPLRVVGVPVVLLVEFVGPTVVTEGVVVLDVTVPSMVVITLVEILLVTVVALAVEVLICRVVLTVFCCTTRLYSCGCTVTV
jgi:hypothetical protein